MMHPGRESALNRPPRRLCLSRRLRYEIVHFRGVPIGTPLSMSFSHIFQLFTRKSDGVLIECSSTSSSPGLLDLMRFRRRRMNCRCNDPSSQLIDAMRGQIWASNFNVHNRQMFRKTCVIFMLEKVERERNCRDEISEFASVCRCCEPSSERSSTTGH